MLPFGTDGRKVRGVAAVSRQVLRASSYHLETTFETANESAPQRAEPLCDGISGD